MTARGRQPWDFDYPLDRGAVRLLAARAGLGGEVRALGAGWDYATFTCAGTVIRVPKRAETATALVEEHALLLRLPALPLPVPSPRAALVLDPVRERGLPYACMLYPLLVGTPLCDAAHTCSPVRLGAIVGNFLRSLHSPETARAASEDVASATTFSFVEWNAWNLRTLGTLAPALETADLAHALELLRRTLPPVRAEHVLAHCDLNDEHILVDAAGEPCGVIDWGDADIAPWWFDFTGLWLWGGDAALDAALAAAERALAPDERVHLAHHVLLVAIGELHFALSSAASPRDEPLARERFMRALAFAAG